jgi:hypothetical protein
MVQARYSVTFCGSDGKNRERGMCVASAAGFYPVAKWNRMYQVYDQWRLFKALC